MMYVLKETNNGWENLMSYLTNIDPLKVWTVTVEQKEPTRSLKQNALMWVWYKYIGDHLGYTPDELHDAFKSKFLGMETKETIFKKKYETIKSTKDLTTKEMSDYMNLIEAFAIKEGVKLPAPDYYGLEQG